MIEPIKPMLASPPKGDQLHHLAGTHVFDIKLDGIRAICYWDGYEAKILNRSMLDITHRFPEVEAMLRCLPYHVVLDGEIVANSGSFQDTAKRDKQNKPFDIVTTMKAIPVTFVAFDVLHAGNVDIRHWPWTDRRDTLNNVDDHITHPTFQASVFSNDADYFNIVKSQGLEGVIAKRKRSTYRSGRSSDWIKFKALRSITAVGVGYEAGKKDSPREHFGAMLLALLDRAGKAVSIGKVGTGFTQTEINYLKAELDQGRPVLVEIECLNKSRDNLLRFPVYKGLRTDMSVLDARFDQLDQIPTM
jgi:bifunctional non-homologous end joining protein LigD